MTGQHIFLFVVSYLIGAIPFGLLIARIFFQTDIRQHGSGNPGATNVWRTLGKKPGIATLFLDITKGVIPVLLARQFFSNQEYVAVTAGLLSIIGHNWSIFLLGSGGKGVATSAGVFLALIPMQAVVALITFAIFFLATKRVSVGSMAAAFGLMISTLFFPSTNFIRITILLAATMLVLKHIPNIKRIAQGTEPKVKF